MAVSEQSFPFEARDIESELIDEIKSYFAGPFSICEVRYGPKGYTLTREFKDIGKKIYNMKVRPEDIFVNTFPKSGTTWTQDMVWLIANNFDFTKALDTFLPVRFPFIDSDMFMNTDVKALLSQAEAFEHAAEALAMLTIEDIINMPSPRFIKTHLPLSLLPPKLLDTSKVVYVARDPRDVAVSFFHHDKMLKTNKEENDFKTYWNLFIRDLLVYTPYFSHVKEAWQARNHPNMLFLFYEELSEDLAACARRVANFLGKDMTDEQLDKLCDHLNIKNFKKNKSVNMEDIKGLGLLNEKENFIRKGKVGGWRDYFDEEMTAQADRWIKQNLQDTDLRFPQQMV